jgi:hypothetical protein
VPQQSNHTLHGFTGPSDSFENRKRAHTVTGARSRHRMPGNRDILFLVIGASDRGLKIQDK